LSSTSTSDTGWSAIGAGRKMDFDDSPPEAVAGVVAEIL
jgi:hypothetical protein